ncbi:hypothetical protein AB0O91_00250 [Kitasatospora sp. NPDC089797]|uniref:hypothetical protein n=1 Tax=Kitasatospora sp. NPDC089797 TaxID=3155298 RepID=UPI003419A34F
MLRIPSDLASCPTNAQQWLATAADDPTVSDEEYAEAVRAVNFAILGDESDPTPAPALAP